MARRAKARDEIHDKLGLGEKPDERRDWFNKVYELAAGDAAGIPWADLEPKAPLLRWLAGQSKEQLIGKAIDVACGLGDNAEALNSAGFDVTAFDYAENAVSWANNRFSGSGVEYVVADLFDVSPDWLGAFDLVHETYTVQALRGGMRRDAIRAIASLVAPGGRLLVITRARDIGEDVEGPPWPLDEEELRLFGSHGLELINLDDHTEIRDRPIRHFTAEFRRP